MAAESNGGTGAPRRLLDGLYLLSGVLAAAFLAAIAVLILAQILGRMAGYAVDSTELSGFFMAASTFLGLAFTFREGGHIRVGLVVSRLAGRRRQAVELWCCLATAALMAYIAWRAALFAWESYEFHDVSPGLLAMPFWIPQSAMAAGLVVLAIALVDAAVAVARGRDAGYDQNNDAALE